MTDPARSHTLPAAWASPARNSGLDHPGLGLVLVFAALSSLPQMLGLAARMVSDDLELDSPEILVFALIAIGLMQLAAGLAIAWQAHTRSQWFAGYVAVSIATLVIAIVRGEMTGPTEIAMLVIELLPGPLIVLLGARLFAVSSGPALAGLLVVGGVDSLLLHSAYAMQNARWIALGHQAITDVLGSLLRLVLAVAVAMLAIRAGVKLARGESGRRALRHYIIAALAFVVLLDAISIIYFVADNEGRRLFEVILPNMIIGLLVSVARLLIIWRYAQRELAAPAPGTAALPWLALFFVAPLLGRLLLYEELGQLGAVTRVVALALCTAIAIAIVIAVKTGRLWWLAAALAGVMLAIAVYLSLTLQVRFGSLGTQLVAPVGLLFAALGTAAWFARKVPSS